MTFDFDAVFMTGPQGSGKGTQSERLAAKLGFFHWDMGAELRAMAAENTPLGHEVADIINNGNFLEDDLLIRILQDRLSRIPQNIGVIFDGVPRRMGQAQYLMQHLREHGRTRFATLYIDIPHDESVRRLMLRAPIEGRADDTPEGIVKRLRFFDEVTKPMLGYLKKETAYFEIDGRPSIEEVEGKIDTALGIMTVTQ